MRHTRLSWAPKRAGQRGVANPMFSAKPPVPSPSSNRTAARVQQARLGGALGYSGAHTAASRSSRALRGRRASRLRGVPRATLNAASATREANGRPGVPANVELTKVVAAGAE